MPVARKLWLPSLVWIPAAAARRADHRIGILLRGSTVRMSLSCTALDRVEKRPFGIVAQPGAVEIGHQIQIFLEVMVAWHCVALAAFFAQAHPDARSCV